MIGLNSTFSATFATESQPGYSTTRTCTRNEYKEKYVPGTRNSPVYIERWEETVEVPCKKTNTTNQPIHHDNKDCSEGTVAGGILGGGIATAISRGKLCAWPSHMPLRKG